MLEKRYRFPTQSHGLVTALPSRHATGDERNLAASPVVALQVIATLDRAASRNTLIALYTFATGREPTQLRRTTTAQLSADVQSAVRDGRLLLVKEAPKTAASGRTQVKRAYPLPRGGQIQLFLRAYAPFATFGSSGNPARMSFRGDGRTAASTNTADSARLTYILPIALSDMKPDLGARNVFCDPSHGTGSVVRFFGRGSVDPQTSIVTSTAQPQATEFFEPVGRPGTGIAGHIEVAAANPLLPSPDIDLRLNVKMVRETDRIHLVGNLAGDRFPNAEAFLRDSTNNTVLLVDYRTDGDRDSGPIKRLFGHGYAITSAFDVWTALNADHTFG